MPRASRTDHKRIPVILDTDIGSDIDDTWALALLLRSPELDLKMVVTDTGNTAYRAKIAARFLEIAERTEVPIGLGLHLEDETGPQATWVDGYELSSYPGTVHEDGIGAMVGCIMASPEPVTLICIGPMPNIAAALDREPAIVDRVRFVGMHGSIRLGYNGNSGACAEYNVAQYPNACREALSARWDVTITPVDTCGLVVLAGDKFRAIRHSNDPLARAVMENYVIWAQEVRWTAGLDPEARSSTLFDTVAVYLAFADELLEMETLGIRVTDDGLTVIDESAKMMRCATAWRDLPAFEDLLVRRLTGN